MEWRTQYFKAYPRLPKIVLPSPKPQADFFELILKRSSRRTFHSTPLSLDEVSVLLKYSCGITRVAPNGTRFRAQPSAGARYPIETYVLNFVESAHFPAGVYHYDVANHQLVVLWKHPFTPEDIGRLFSYEWVAGASIAIIMTAVFDRNQMKYGERGYRYMLIEAGHIGQNFCLTAEALTLKCCALVGTQDESIERLLDIDGVTESVMYALAIGK